MKYVQDVVGENVDVVSVSGMYLEDLVEFLPVNLCMYEFVVVHCGTNDMVDWRSEREFERVKEDDVDEKVIRWTLRDMQRVVSTILDRSPRTKVIISGILPRGVSMFVGGKSARRINELNKRAFRFNCIVNSIVAFS